SNISDFDPVYLHNGEFFYTATDVTLPGEGLDFQFTRIYRSRSEFLGGLGWQWTHNLAERLIPWESPEGFGFTHVDGEGKKYFLKEVETTPEGFALQLSNGGRRYFDEEGKLTAIQNGSGKKWTLRYNEAGQLQKVVETKGREIRFNYYPNGLLKSLEDHTGRTWSYQYNEDHDLIAAATPGTAAFPEGKTTRYAYEDHRLTLIMDPKGQVYLQNYYGKGGRDAGKILAQQYGEHMAVASYDGDDAWVIDRRGVLHAYRHDDEGQLVNRFVPDSEDPVENRLPRARADFPILLDEEYDGWGNIVSVKYADGTERRLEIDAGNLVTKEVFGGEERFYKYDANDNIVEMDIPSRRLKLEFKYDVLDRLTAKEEMREGRPTLLTRYEYDPQGRLTQRIDPEGAAVHLAYDAAGRLMTIAEKGRSWHFDEQRRRMEHAAPGFKQEFFYDAGGEVVYAVDYNDLENPGDDVAVDLKYDARGRLVGEKMHDQWVNKSFDEKDQKIGVTYPNGLQIIREYQDGKIANVFANGRPLPQFFSGDTILNSDELSIVSPDLRRDANGNLLEDDRLVYRYDALNRLIWVQDKAGGGIVSYHYDPFSRVAREIRGGKVLRHFYDELNRIAAVRPDGTRQSFIYAADLDQPIAFYNNDDLYFYHLDPRGSVRQITDEAGNVMAHYDYLPFGERTVLASSGIENDLGYIGRPHDPTTGLVNLRYRFYAPRHHVFLTADPLGVKNKFSPQIRTPVNLSFHHGLGGSTRTAFPYRMDLFGDPRLSPTPDEDLFAYADGDPLRYYDPLGLFKVEMKKPPAWNSFRWNDDFHLQKLSLDLQAHDSVKLPSLFEPAPLWGCNRIPGAFLTQRLEF
ncbi:MAG: hypothetical protein HY609_06555, partial [Deltaproteobacteria bacterium]|nr:hypothetical protein [Deltaproteobacteria bacterium]